MTRPCERSGGVLGGMLRGALDPGLWQTYNGAMFGFSLQKIIVLVAIVAAVWYGFKFLSRLDASRKAEAKVRHAKAKTKGRGKAAPPAADEPEDMVQCPVCGAYVAARASSSCGRDDCPY